MGIHGVGVAPRGTHWLTLVRAGRTLLSLPASFSRIDFTMTRHGFVLSLMLLTATLARADKITIAAGGGTSTSDGPATQSKMVQTFGVDFGADGTIYIVEMAGGERLLALDAKGNLRTLAGTFGKKGTDDGPAAKALFNGMHSLAVAPDGTIYLADTFSSTVFAPL